MHPANVQEKANGANVTFGLAFARNRTAIGRDQIVFASSVTVCDPERLTSLVLTPARYGCDRSTSAAQKTGAILSVLLRIAR